MAHGDDKFDVLIVGAGAAGLAAAVFAGRRGASALVLEKLESPGRKLLSTGGGHCNITNKSSREDLYGAFGRAGRFIAPAIEVFDNKTMEKFFAELGVPLHSPDGFHVLPKSGRALDILNALLSECRKTNVRIINSCKVEDLLISGNSVIGVRTGAGDFHGDRTILSTGGMSYPQLGSTGDGYRLAKIAGHSVIEPVPALVEISCVEKWPANLAGLSLKDVEISIPGSRIQSRRGEFLFTHRGISGPAALDISGDLAELVSKNGSAKIKIDFTPEISEKQWLAKIAEWRVSSGASRLANLLSSQFPKSLSETLCSISNANVAKASQLDAESQKRLAANISGTILNVNGTAGFSKAMLTKGGIPLKEVDPKTLGSRIIGGLYFAGEILDLQGPCGGYNLQWAFSSGILAQEDS